MLAKTGCISDAAKAARISTTTVDRWRRKDGRFAQLCQAALDKAGSKIELLAWERAVTGIEEPVYSYGKFSHMRVKRSDAIFRMLLIASNPAKYGRMGAVSNKKAEEQLREKILEEMRQAEPPIEEVREEILRKLDAIRRHSVRSGELVELPDGRAVEPREAQAMGYEVTPSGDPEAPYKVEFKGPDFTPLPRPGEEGPGAAA